MDRNNNGIQEWEQGDFDNDGDVELSDFGGGAGGGYQFKVPVGKVAVRHVPSERVGIGYAAGRRHGGHRHSGIGGPGRFPCPPPARLGRCARYALPDAGREQRCAALGDSRLFAGWRIDPEANGQPNATATGDDVSNADEDGVTGMSPLVSGGTATVLVEFRSDAGQTGVLDAWMDFNANGSWADLGERIATGLVLSPGPNTLSVAVPGTATPGTTYARFRLSPNGVSTFTGTGIAGAARTAVLHGEVEDYQVRIEPGRDSDWGDAPDTAGVPGPAPYPTLSIHNGAR